MNTHPLKHTLRKLGTAFFDGHYGNGFMYLTTEDFKQILQDRTALLELTEEIIGPQCKWYRMGEDSIAARDWLDKLYKQFVKDCIEGGVSKETVLWLHDIGQNNFDPPLWSFPLVQEHYWDNLNLRRLKQEQKELKKATTRKKAQGRLIL